MINFKESKIIIILRKKLTCVKKWLNDCKQIREISRKTKARIRSSIMKTQLITRFQQKVMVVKEKVSKPKGKKELFEE